MKLEAQWQFLASVVARLPVVRGSNQNLQAVTYAVLCVSQWDHAHDQYLQSRHVTSLVLLAGCKRKTFTTAGWV